MRKIISRYHRIITFVLFSALLIWGWRIGNPFTNIPGYGDALEVIWGIEQYYKSILQDHTLPLFTDRIFFPGGFYSTTLNHTPFLFLIAQPFRIIGGPAFAYNCLALLALTIIFTGSYRFLRIYVSHPIASIAALMLTFWNFHWFRILGHIHVLFMLSLAIWMTYFLVYWKEGKGFSHSKIAILNGILWGLMINFSLYSIFIGGWITLLICGKRGIRILLQSAVIALLSGSFTILLYYDGASKSQFTYFGATHSAYWGASINSLIIPSVFHPVEQIRNWSQSIYSGPYNESGVANIGFVTLLLALVGTIAISRQGKFHSYSHLVLLSVVGFVLALGPFLRWNGQFVSMCILEPLTSLIWQIGQTLKPQLFDTTLPSELRCAVPLPGLLLNATVPFWEGGRVVSRYAMVSALGLVPLAAIGLAMVRPRIRAFLMILWLLEFLPNPIYGVPLPTQPHPAYVQISQKIQPDESIVEVSAHGLRIGGEVLYNSMMTNIPTVSGTGSFYPIHTIPIWQYLINSSSWAEEGTVDVLRQYGVRFVLVHRLSREEDSMIEMMNRNSKLHFEKCFDQPPQPSPWNFPICVFEIKESNDNSVVLFRSKGWSTEEEWGIWAEGTGSEASFILSRPEDLQIYINAIPFCLQEKNQAITVIINNVQLIKYRWSSCKPISKTIMIPSVILKSGINRIQFVYDYAARPIEITNGQNKDSRLLSVGFAKLEINRVGLRK